MIFTVEAAGFMDVGGRRVRCALGAGGVTPAERKREGDGATPAGEWPLRRLLWRPDRGKPPACRLPMRPLAPADGWCDDPADRRYNRSVTLPCDASAEALWRDDGLYDLIVVLGYNDDPVTPGAGSAIFLHLAADGYAPTRGCIALGLADMTRFLALAGPGDILAVRP